MPQKKKSKYKFDESFVQDKEIVKMAHEVVFANLFTEEAKEILAEKGFPNPTLQERALWVAYGLFNALDSTERKGFEDLIDPFIEKLDDFIEEHGGWEYFPC